LFKDLTGSSWYDDVYYQMDDEHKITEFDYENYIHPSLITPEVSESKEFKNFVRILNLFTKTRYEKL
jgi:hypothetical protein